MTTQPKPSPRAPSNSNLFLLSLIALFSCIIGTVLGAGGLLVYQQLNDSDRTELSLPLQSTAAIPNSISLAPPSDGFFLVSRGNLLPLPAILNDSQLDISSLPSADNTILIILIQGDDFPLGNLKLKGYRAGIGVDLTFGQAGATVNKVFPGSPAEAADVQPGDVILTLNGEPVKSPIGYTPGQNDLFGSMKDRVELEVARGTSTRKINLPRDFRGSISSFMQDYTTIPFSIESQGNFVVLSVKRELEPGVYRFEFEQPTPRQGGVGVGLPTLTPTIPPVSIPPQKWVFVIK